AAKTTGVVTATITDTAAATLAGLTGTGNAYSVTVTGTASAADLNTIDSKTTVAVNATGVTAITGTAADFATLVAAASATPATITLKPDFTATVSGFIAVAEVNAVAAKTTGVVTATLTTGNLQSFAALTETGNAYTITLTDTSADIADLIAMNERTSVPVDAQSVATITSASTTIIDLTAAGVTWKSGITVSGTAGSDSINATAGNDSMTGGAGADTLDGGSGDDSIAGGAGTDSLSGGDGDDLFVFAAPADLFAGTAFVDSIDGGLGTDTIRLDTTAAVTMANTVSFARVSEVEKLVVNGANSNAISLALDVTAFTTAGIRTVDLTSDTNVAGINVINASTQADTTKGLSLLGSAGADSITGGSGDDSIVAGDGNNTITGGGGVDTLVGGTGADTFVYNTMAEFVSGNAGTDRIVINDAIAIDSTVSFARAGTTEQLLAQTQAGTTRAHSVKVDQDAKLGSIVAIDLSGDTNTTSSGVIDLSGVTTAMTLKGVGAGANTLTGGTGADTITGGSGVDSLNGNAGNDTFVYARFLDLIELGNVVDSVTGGTGVDTIRIDQATTYTIAATDKFDRISLVETISQGVA
ncbi:MAG: hypothetical protein EBX68_09635, partial [Betaproteobacteria bacterium]|nr:hypothetical protein [Betaproteobacteria bacterium]